MKLILQSRFWLKLILKWCDLCFNWMYLFYK